MKRPMVQMMTLLSILTILGLTLLPTGTAQAAYCQRSGCNGIDPYGKDCWSDAYNAAISYASTMYNANKYSPGCFANYSYTSNSASAYLAAETVGVFTYHGDWQYLYVWNSMWDGSGTVCTKGYMGSAYKVYTVSTSAACA